jgi:trimethylamine--corrinoid protein Co-methyltransferase
MEVIMRSNYIQYNSPQFRILSDNQIEELHFGALQILERTGVAFECQEATEILGDAGADISNVNRVKIPSFLVEQALRTAPKMITLYTRDGEPAIVLNGKTGAHFGAVTDCPEILDPYTKKRRQCYVEDIGNAARLIDALPNIEWMLTASSHPTLPGEITDKISLLQAILNSSKPVACCINDVSSLREMIDLCSMVAGGEKQLRRKPFFIGSSEPVSPLIQGKDAMEKSLLCAEKGIPNFVYSMPMAGATSPATFGGVLAIASAEVLAQLVVLQLKYPGAPVIFGAMPNIMDMKTTIYPYGAPELTLLIGALTEISHYYKLPILGTAGCTDAEIIGAQAAAEATYQILISALSGADFVHDVGLLYHASIISTEMMVLGNEIIDMVKVLMGGIEVNDETLPLNLIERVGPRNSFLSEQHTFKHFRKFWVPKIFDRSMSKTVGVKDCEEQLNQETIKTLETYRPKPLPEDLVRELKKVEKTWFDRVGLKHEYPKLDEN